jgi:hypothetical protein
MEGFDARVAKMEAAGEKALSGPDAIGRYQQQSSQALRCMVLKNLINAGCRELSRQLAMCELYQWFCRVQRVPVVRAPSKSTLNDYGKWLPAEQMNALLDTLGVALRDEARAKIIGLEHELDMAVVWVDSTCLKANILSLYESDIHVIVRGKAGAAVEFGNSLLLGETSDGYIMDHELMKDRSPGDPKWLEQRYPGMKKKSGGQLCGLITDRGFESKANRRMLEEDGVFNGLCPRNPQELAERMEKDEVFAAALRRRAQTEGRGGILKNVF